ncbi:MAG: L-2-hydroxyglutarate oxidase [Bacteroidota bacterium]
MYDVAIIGAGIVGLATGYRLLKEKPGLKIAILDKEETVAAHQTSHNSGVIHSGIYYKPGSLKATICRQGYQDLLVFSKEFGIPHDVCGKVIVATKEEERGLLDGIFQRGIANGMQGIKKISPAELKEIEPHASGVEAIWVPQAGIISYKKVAEKYLELIAERGGEAFLGNKVIDIKLEKNQVRLVTSQREIASRLVINCAGLYADKVAEASGKKLHIKVLPFRGEYYLLAKEKQYLVRNLIYPVPNPAFPFLGVHYTRMIEGGIEAGPNAVLAFRREGYSRWNFHLGEFSEILAFPGFRKLAAKYWRLELDELHRSFSKKAFVKALQHLVPEVGFNDLEKGGSGVRAQAVDANGNLIDDFYFVESQNIINVINAPSPAATASLAIGKTIADMALRKLN